MSAAPPTRRHTTLSTYALVCCVAAMAVPASLEAQLGIAARAGTLGIGAEGALGLGERVVLRGGFGVSSLEASTTFDDLSVDLTLPESWYNVGIDIYLNGAMRLGGGILFKPDDPTLTGSFTDPVDIGGRTFTPGELGSLTGTIESAGQVGYALLGFGKHTDRGFGLSIDFGVAFFGDPNVALTAQGGTFSDAVELESRLAAEAQAFEDDMKTYLRFWPVLSLGLRLGTG